MTQTLADEVAANETRLRHLELKSEADDRLIALLKQQNAQQNIELTELRQQRDVAERKATEVCGIIETLGSLSLAGINKMRGDPPPADKPAPQIVKHLQTAAERALPRPTLMDQARS